MNPKQLFNSAVFALSASFLFISCKSKKTEPCGDPPVAEAPVMRFRDKMAGKDYFIQHPDMLNKLAIKSLCSNNAPEGIYFEPLKKNNITYGYVVSYNYLPLPKATESANCRTYIWTWNGSDDDTLTYFTHNDAKKCYTLAVLDSIYYNGVKVDSAIDTNSVNKQTYYTVIK